MQAQFDRNTGVMNQGKRALFMLAFWIASRIALAIVIALALFQLIWTVITRSPNDKIIRFGRSLGAYLSQIVNFLTYTTDQKPWPFQDWPDHASGVWSEAEND
ncbi:hypothetical protein DSLASN_09240 [Desulfoluna limicola]|uniref:Lipase n=1 Tax=Desulfoluna limicola TaxID=2810562 RepID=A0ABM7PDI5_9BACT|nr:DUF4389 domain-containing protein [Desulfoluna limicola]BCS95292.1 hypothetical protein DSLASN_09240 [Desulfoluna limicola]